MKPSRAPDVPGTTEFEKFDNAVKMVLSIPAEAAKKEKKRMKRAALRGKRARERAASRTTSR